MDVLQQLFSTFRVTSEIFHNGQYCGNWALDTSGDSYITFHIISHGRCQLQLEGEAEVHHLSAGDMVLFPTDISHCMTNDGHFTRDKNVGLSVDFSQGKRKDGVGIICGYFKHSHPMMKTVTEYLPEMVLLKAYPTPIADKQKESTTSNSLPYLLQALIQESLTAEQGANMVTNKIAEAALAIIFREHLTTDHGILAALVHPKLNKAIKAIHQAPATKWTVDTLASLCFMSRAGFSTEFKQVMRQSPMDYVTQWRISLAYRMLIEDNATILESALACGYDNESSFSKAFKRVMGKSPGAVKQHNHN